MKRERVVLAALIGAVVASPALAGVIITVEETGSDVLASGGGTLDLSGWTFAGPEGLAAQIDPDELLVMGNGDIDFYFNPINFAGPSSIGPGTVRFWADFENSDVFGLVWGQPLLPVQTGYVSGDPLSGEILFENHTLATLGLAPGSYTWTWDTTTRASDFFTIDVIPEPTTLSLLALGGLLAIRRRHRSH